MHLSFHQFQSVNVPFCLAVAPRQFQSGMDRRVVLLQQGCKCLQIRDRTRETGFKARGRQRTDSTHVLAAIRAITRLACVGETMRHALDTLAIAAPNWLRVHSVPAWVEEARLPTSDSERQAYANLIGDDGLMLPSAVYAADAPSWLRQLPAVETLRRVMLQN